MKKLGTPSGAAPGSAKENVGLAGVGTPFLVAGACGLVGLLVVPVLVTALVALLALSGDEVFEPPWLFGLWLAGRVAFDGVGELEELVGPPTPLGPELVVIVGVVLVVVVGVHDSVALEYGPVPGGINWETGVPGGALTLKVSCEPLTSVIVTVH